jgi:hypothetical protein
MENKEINLKINSNIDDVTKEIKSLNKSLDNTTDVVKDVGKSTKEVEKNTKTLADGFKGVGLAIKAMGIGLVISAMGTLKEVFMSNQKVADTVATGFGTVVNVFTKVVDVVVSVVEKVNKSSEGFKGLSAVISGLITISLTPLKLGFYAISLAIDEARLAWEESFFGDKDPKTINELNKRISETKDNIVEVGKDAVDAGKKVANNIGAAITEVGAVVEGTIDGVSKISVSAAYEQAKANTQLQNTAKLAEANQARLVEQYDRQAEKLRQIRDNDLISIDDRIKANNDLKDVLDKQQKAMIGQADMQIAAARNTYEMNKSIENQVALTNALANREGVLAQVEGLRSEQIANNIALTKEKTALQQSELEGITNLSIEQKKFNAELEKDDLLRLQKQKAVLEEEKAIELARLQSKIDAAALGTQARIDAENEYKTKSQEINNEIITNKAETDQVILDQEKAVAEGKKAIQDASFAAMEGGINLLKGLFEKNKAIQKGLLLVESAVGIAKIVTNTVAADAADGLVAATMGPAGIAYKATKFTLNRINAGIGIAANIAATAKALSALGGGGSSSKPDMGGGAGGGGGSAAPQFNVVGQGGANQIAESMANRESQPIKAYVVGQDVTTSQSLNRSIVNNATLG